MHIDVTGDGWGRHLGGEQWSKVLRELCGGEEAEQSTEVLEDDSGQTPQHPHGAFENSMMPANTADSSGAGCIVERQQAVFHFDGNE